MVCERNLVLVWHNGKSTAASKVVQKLDRKISPENPHNICLQECQRGIGSAGGEIEVRSKPFWKGPLSNHGAFFLSALSS